MPTRANANPPLLVALSAFHFTIFPIPIITLFWRDHAGMSMTDIMVLQAIFGLAVVVVEFPSGYFADRAGYRLSVLMGAALWMVGWFAYTQGTTFAAIAVAEIILGAGNAFVSGADRALLWTSLDARGQTTRYLRWEGRLRASGQASEAASAAVGGWLYALHPRLPFWLQVPVSAASVLSALAMREAPRAAASVRHGHLRHAAAILRLALRDQPRLRAALLLNVALGMGTFLVLWLIQPLAHARGVPTAWFGPLWALAHVWLVGVSLSSARVVDALGRRAVLAACWLLIPAGYLGLLAGASAWGLAFYLCFMTVRGLQGPILAAVMQEDAPGEDRAAVLSLSQLAFRLAFVITGPPIGVLADRAGLHAALVVLAVAMTALAGAALVAFLRADASARARA